MNARVRTLSRVVAVAAAVLVLSVAPAAATESGGSAPGEESGRITVPESDHDRFGLVLIGLLGVAALAGLGNAVKQLRGRRPQADGRIRWR